MHQQMHLVKTLVLEILYSMIMSLIQITNNITTEEQFRIYRTDPTPYPLADVPLRFPLGTYVQVDNEIMRIKSNTSWWNK